MRERFGKECNRSLLLTRMRTLLFAAIAIFIAHWQTRGPVGENRLEDDEVFRITRCGSGI